MAQDRTVHMKRIDAKYCRDMKPRPGFCHRLDDMVRCGGGAEKLLGIGDGSGATVVCCGGGKYGGATWTDSNLPTCYPNGRHQWSSTDGSDRTRS